MQGSVCVAQGQGLLQQAPAADPGGWSGSVDLEVEGDPFPKAQGSELLAEGAAGRAGRKHVGALEDDRSAAGVGRDEDPSIGIEEVESAHVGGSAGRSLSPPLPRPSEAAETLPFEGISWAVPSKS